MPNFKKEIALGKKKLRKKLSSKGQRPNVSKKTKVTYWSVAERLIFKAEARAQGKRVCETIANPDKSDTSRLFIRVCTQGKKKNG